MSDGFRRFIASDTVRAIKESRLPQIDKEWAALPAGFRAMLYKNAGINPDKVPDGLRALTDEQRRSLQAANVRLGEIQAKAGRLLVGAIIYKPRG